MTMSNLTIEGEFRYIVQWFNEWSELQRDDFVPIVIDYLTKETPGVYVNGVVSGLANADIMDKPMSLFQCRIKLFKEWTPKWPEDMKQKLSKKIMEMDPKVGEKLFNELKGVSGASNIIEIISVNGNTTQPTTISADEVIAAAVAVVEDTEIALNSASVLNGVLATDTLVVNEDMSPVIDHDEQVVEQVVQEFIETVSVNDDVPLVV